MPKRKGSAVTQSVEEAFGPEEQPAESGNLPKLDQPDGPGRQLVYDENGRQLGAQAFAVPPGMELAEMELPELDISTVPTYEQRMAEAKMPVQVSAEQIMDHDVLWVAWRPQDALLPGDGTITEGFFAVGKDLETGKAISIFIGGIALCRTLRNVKAPMVARIGKKGRTLVFQ